MHTLNRPATDPDPCCQQSAVSQGSSSATDAATARPRTWPVQTARCPASPASLTRRAHLLYHQRIIYPPQPTPSAFATGRFSIGHSVFATEPADCEPLWANTHSLGEWNMTLDRIASSHSGPACELLNRRARSTDARPPYLKRSHR